MILDQMQQIIDEYHLIGWMIYSVVIALALRLFFLKRKIVRDRKGKMSVKITQEEYNDAFKNENKEDIEKQKKALEHALDIRKFEIDLYWKRAAYFWTFIGATLAGYGAVQALSISESVRIDLSIILACMGFVFSFGWFCVNKASKQWQENWENHVDVLEDKIIGPLYKVVLKRPKSTEGNERIIRFITGPSSLSVSKINQIISLYVTVIWGFLVYKSLPEISLSAEICWKYVYIISGTIYICTSFFWLGSTDQDDHEHDATKRKSEII